MMNCKHERASSFIAEENKLDWKGKQCCATVRRGRSEDEASDTTVFVFRVEKPLARADFTVRKFLGEFAGPVEFY